MIKGKTKTGFIFEIEDNALDNMELLDAIAEIDNEENPLAISKVINLLLGKEEKKKLYNHCRAEDGRVPIEALVQEVAEIFESLGEKGKNLEPSLT